METYSNSAREVEMPNGDVVVLHSAPTGGANTTSNIKKFKYDDNGHVTESDAANATDLNLNSYSTPTTGSTAIGTSDAVQTAIGKLDHQSQIDQSNILYTLGRTGKNLYDIMHPTRAVNITVTDDGNGQFTQTASGAWAAWDYDFDVTVGTQYTVYIKFKSVTTSNAAGAVVLKDANGNDIYRASINTPQTFEYTFTAPTSWVRIGVTANNSSYNQSGTFVMQDPMVVEKAVYDKFSDYQPYQGRPNYDLTRLEAEDRASLAEVVDSGAKNLFDWTQSYQLDNCSVSNGVYTTQGDTATTLRLQITLYNSGGIVQQIANTSGQGYTPISANGVYEFPFTYTGGDWFVIGHNGSTYNGRFRQPTTGLVNGKQYVIRLEVTQATNASGQFKWKDIMLATKAAFGVSPKFVPYRPNYDLVCDSVIDLNDMISSFIVNSSKSVSIKLRRDSSFTMLMFGFVQTIGKVHWYIESNTSTSVSVIDAMTGSAVSQSVISFAYSESTAILTISANVSGNCNFVLIRSAY